MVGWGYSFYPPTFGFVSRFTSSQPKPHYGRTKETVIICRNKLTVSKEGGENMKKILIGLLSFVLVFAVATTVKAAKPTSTDSNGLETAWENQNSVCTKIQDGILEYPAGRYLAGQPLVVGFDEYGYNYQSHLFKGYYANVYLNGDNLPAYTGDGVAYLLANPGALSKWYWPYRDYDLQMKWNDTWIANTDCNNDGLLDRHFGFSSYIGSGAWQTNQYGGDGWAALTKFSAVPADANRIGPANTGIWYTADGVEIGTDIWGEFAITQDVLSGEGALYVSPAGPGYGQY